MRKCFECKCKMYRYWLFKCIVLYHKSIPPMKEEESDLFQNRLKNCHSFDLRDARCLPPAWLFA